MGQGGYEQIGSPADVPNVNPYTGELWNLLTGANGIGSQFQGLTPDAIMANLVGQAPALQGLVSQFTSPYQKAAFGQAAIEAEQAAKSIGQQYAGEGALHSGAYESAVARGTALPFAQALTGVAGMGTSLAGGLMSQYTGLAGQRAGSLASLLGTGFQAAMPEWYEPAYAYKPGFWDYAGPIFGQLGGAAAGAFGGAMGAPVGAITNAYGATITPSHPAWMDWFGVTPGGA